MDTAAPLVERFLNRSRSAPSMRDPRRHRDPLLTTIACGQCLSSVWIPPQTKKADEGDDDTEAKRHRPRACSICSNKE